MSGPACTFARVGGSNRSRIAARYMRSCGNTGSFPNRLGGYQFRGFARVAPWERRSASSPLAAVMAHAMAPAALTAVICLGASASGPCPSRQNPACQEQRLPPPARTTLSKVGGSEFSRMPVRRTAVEWP